MMSTDCIIWDRNIHAGGYGRVYHKGKLVYAHRWALAQHQGIEIPDVSVSCLHSCDNPPCVNPDHLRWGTQRDNINDMVGRGRWNGSGRHKVSEESIALANDLRVQGKTYQYIANVLGISKKHAWNITKGE